MNKQELKKEEISYVSYSAKVDNYDFFHEILLYSNGKVEFWDGGCQLQLGHAVGNYNLKTINENEIKIEFFNCLLTDPYDDSIIFTEIKPFEVQAIKKETYLIFGDAPVHHPKEQYIYLYYYQFNKDPLAIFREYSSYYDSKYMDKEMVEYMNEVDANNKERLRQEFSDNGIRLNALETKFYYSKDKIIRKTIEKDITSTRNLL